MTSRALALLSGEGTTLPPAEARALFLAYDRSSAFEAPEPRVLVADTHADPFMVGSRIAFTRRVGVLVDGPSDAAELLRGKRVRFRSFDLRPSLPAPLAEDYLGDTHAAVDLIRPDLELTLVRGEREYLAVTSPGSMRQGWSRRRPRSRAFFHPSAIFPKLSRALVNLSGCTEGSVFLDPFAGTGSLAIEASIVGAEVVVADQLEKMARGSLANMKHFGQSWLGVVRADSFSPPLAFVDSIATDVPYGRVSSTRGKKQPDVLRGALDVLPRLLRPGGTLVVMHPRESEVTDSADLELMEEHHLYVHKLLTRTISILRRR